MFVDDPVSAVHQVGVERASFAKLHDLFRRDAENARRVANGTLFWNGVPHRLGARHGRAHRRASARRLVSFQICRAKDG